MKKLNRPLGTLQEFWCNPPALLNALADDIERIDEDLYGWDMSSWHVPTLNGRCAICLGGAMMAGRLGADPKKALYPKDFDGETQTLLQAVDDFRKGEIVRALRGCGLTSIEISRLVEDGGVQAYDSRLVDIEFLPKLHNVKPNTDVIRRLSRTLQKAMEAAGITP